MKKSIISLVFILLLCFPLLAFADTLTALPMQTEQTHAVLLQSEDSFSLVGCGDVTAVSAELQQRNIQQLAYVFSACEHPEHMTGCEEIATQFGAEYIDFSEVPESTPLTVSRSDGVLLVSSDKASYAFTSNEAVKDTISFLCDGSLLPFKAATNEASVNVRAETSTKAKRVGKLKRGVALTVLDVLENDKNEIWYQIQLSDGTTGYIRSDLLSIVSEEEVAEIAEETQKENRYIGNKKSKVFHRPSCGSLPSGKNQVYFSSRSYALAKGYKPCSHCDP